VSAAHRIDALGVVFELEPNPLPRLRAYADSERAAGEDIDAWIDDISRVERGDAVVISATGFADLLWERRQQRWTFATEWPLIVDLDEPAQALTSLAGVIDAVNAAEAQLKADIGRAGGRVTREQLEAAEQLVELGPRLKARLGMDATI
jgi:hypothetical protein